MMKNVGNWSAWGQDGACAIDFLLGVYEHDELAKIKYVWQILTNLKKNYNEKLVLNHKQRDI